MASQSKYAVIRADLEGRIRSGELAPGDRLPTERELCEEFGVSRATAQRAVSTLVEAGLVVRRRRAGTIVTAAATDLMQWTNFLISGSEEHGSHRVVSTETVPAEDLDIDFPGLNPDDPVHSMLRLKTDRSGQPTAIEHHYIPFSIAPRILREDLTTLVSHEYYRRIGVEVVKSRIYLIPGVASDDEARLLEIPPGTPLFRSRRETSLPGGQIAEIYVAVLAPHAHQLFVEQTLAEAPDDSIRREGCAR